jgi:hypothetical protein
MHLSAQLRANNIIIDKTPIQLLQYNIYILLWMVYTHRTYRSIKQVNIW